ncbi:hypothetical protein BH23BAC4_BH23BAC4_11670 [soil metagenome]
MKHIATTLLGLLICCAPVAAQDAGFGTLLLGEREVGPVITGADGFVYGILNGPVLTISGAFRGLESDYMASHIHIGQAVHNGGVIFGLSPTLHEDNRGGSFDPEVAGNSGVLNETQLAALMAGGLYVNVHSAGNPGGEVRGNLRRVPIMNGNLNDAQYQTLAMKQNENQGFGENINVSAIRYYVDEDAVFIGVVGKMNTGSGDGIGLWLGFSGLNGAAAATPLGRPGAGHYMGGDGGGHANFQADFEVDYMFAINPGGSTDNAWLDAYRLAGTEGGQFLGNAGQMGAPSFNQTGGDLFDQFSVAFAFNNSGGAQTGLEMVFPYRYLGLTAEDASRMLEDPISQMQAFTFVVAQSAWFSDVTVPGNVTDGNPGANPDFSTLAGGPYSTDAVPIPVELTSFSARVDGRDMVLSWTTASETNNAGFGVEMRSSTQDAFREVNFVSGAGTTSSERNYGLTVPSLEPGRYTIRLRQVDFDGTNIVVGSLEVAVQVDGTHLIASASPNPFVESTRFSLSVSSAQHVTVNVFDTLGRRVATLFDGVMEADLATQIAVTGADLPAGVYFIRAQGETFGETLRVTRR